MKVNFNNLRKQALYSYDHLCTKLNESIKDKSFAPEIVIDPDEIQQDMDDLRSLLFSIACVYQEDNADFKDVSEELGEIATFNEEPEEV